MMITLDNNPSILVTQPPLSAGLQGQLLVAMPNMDDVRFAQTLMLICHHDDNGALGLVLNRTTDLTLQDLCIQMDMEHVEHPSMNAPVHIGGPVDSHRGFVLHTDNSLTDKMPSWQHVVPIITALEQTLYLTTSLDILQSIALGQGPEHFIFALGCAGWSAGQLEKELLDNVWLNVNIDTQLLFSTSIEERWQQAFQSLGFSLANLCSQAGHA